VTHSDAEAVPSPLSCTMGQLAVPQLLSAVHRLKEGEVTGDVDFLDTLSMTPHLTMVPTRSRSGSRPTSEWYLVRALAK
jgi:hypothetical protein